MMPEFTIDGARTVTLEAFYDEVSRVLTPDLSWGRNLDAFNDVLRGGFGTPQEGFTFRWASSAVSRQHLGYPETTRQLEMMLATCHQESRVFVARELDEARAARGPTVFDWLVDILRSHEDDGDLRLILD